MGQRFTCLRVFLKVKHLMFATLQPARIVRVTAYLQQQADGSIYILLGQMTEHKHFIKKVLTTT